MTDQPEKPPSMSDIIRGRMKPATPDPFARYRTEDTEQDTTTDTTTDPKETDQ